MLAGEIIFECRPYQGLAKRKSFVCQTKLCGENKYVKTLLSENNTYDNDGEH